MRAQASLDLVDKSIKLGFPESSEFVQFHYIYPKSWCNDNASGKLSKILDPKKAEQNWVDSVANLMPLSRISNNKWKSKNPGQILTEKGIAYKDSEEIFKVVFIDKKAYSLLTNGASGIPDFWNHRASLLAEDFLNRVEIKI